MNRKDDTDTVPHIPVGVYRFVFETKNGFEQPALPGILWHSVFGKALHQISCTQSGTECHQCSLLHNCDYPYLFRPIAPPESEMLRGKPAPTPHIFRYRKQLAHRVKKGERFSMEIVIVGEAVNKLTRVIQAVQTAGVNGIGKNRSQADLLFVEQVSENGKTVRIIEEGKLALNSPPIVKHTVHQTDPQQELQIKFVTPYIPSGKEYRRQFNLAHMLMGIVRRASLLQYFYTGKKLNADFLSLKSQTEIAIIRSSELKWEPHQRYSATHGNVIRRCGWSGSIDISLQSASELWPYLFIGQWLNVGKNASMGFGRYALNKV